jgi:hypothetical protein
MDLSNIQFNPNQKKEAAARDASTGVRLMLVGFAAALLSLVLAIAAQSGAVPAAMAGIAVVALWVVSVAGVYGAYLAANALDWPGAATAAIVLGVFVPYLKLVVWLVLLVFSLNLIHGAGFKFSLVGRLQKRAVA